MSDQTKVWFVTGASRGLGRAIATAAAQAGDRVVATARDTDSLSELFAKYPDLVLPVRLDVTDYSQAEAAVQAALDRFGRIDVIVNNAGYGNLGSIEDTPMEGLRAQIDTNLFGVINVCKASIRVLREQGSGHIINISSLGGRIANAGLAPYQLSKFAVSGFSMALAAELAPLGIRVTAAEPGGIRTDWAGSSMTIYPSSPAYEGSVGTLATLFANGSVRGAGDPSKMAVALRRLVELPEPPTRILFGSDALGIAAFAADAQAKSDRKFDALSRSTDADDATAHELDPLGLGVGAS